MASYDDDRRELYDLLEAGLGSRGAGLLMAQLPPVAWTELATKPDLAALRSELRGEMAELRGEMAELRGEMAELRGEFKHDLASMKTSMQVTVIGSTIGSMIGLAGLVFAVASFAR